MSKPIIVVVYRDTSNGVSTGYVTEEIEARYFEVHPTGALIVSEAEGSIPKHVFEPGSWVRAYRKPEVVETKTDGN